MSGAPDEGKPIGLCTLDEIFEHACTRFGVYFSIIMLVPDAKEKIRYRPSYVAHYPQDLEWVMIREFREMIKGGPHPEGGSSE